MTHFLAILLFVFSFIGDTRGDIKQPEQPASGPGGKDYKHAEVKKTKYLTGGQEYWIFEPGAPAPRSAPVIVFLHGWSAMNPSTYGAWVEHIVRRGNIVIYPRYQENLATPANEFTPNMIVSVKDAVQRLKTESGHVKPEFDKFAAVGHSMGGILTANLAALAKESGLPKVRAAMAVEPGVTWRKTQRVSITLEDLSKIPAGTLLLSIAGDQDLVVIDVDAKRIYKESTKVPEKNKDYITMVTDNHGLPAMTANHYAPVAMNFDYDSGERSAGGTAGNGDGSTEKPGKLRRFLVDAFDYYGTWKLFDGITDAAFYGKNREYALGNTPQQRFMGKWSDGTPVKELTVTDNP